MLAIDIEKRIFLSNQQFLHEDLFYLCDFIDTEFKDRLRFVFKPEQRYNFETAKNKLKDKKIIFNIVDYN